MSGVDRISMALLEDAGIDPSRSHAIRYEHHVGEYPTLIVELAHRNGDKLEIKEDEVTLVKFEWRQAGEERLIRRGTPEWDEWIKEQPTGDE